MLLKKFEPLTLEKGQKPVTDELGHYVIGLTPENPPRLSLYCCKASIERTVGYRDDGVFVCGCCNADVTALREAYLKQRFQEPVAEKPVVEAEPQDPYVTHNKRPATAAKEQGESSVAALGKDGFIQCPQCAVKASRLAYEPTVSGFVSRLLCPYCGKPIEEHQ
jgi:hypothetical protein